MHMGDNRTGDGDGDDEKIMVNLTRAPENVNSFVGQNFAQIENAICHIVNLATNQEVASFNLSTLEPHNAQIMAKIYRHNGE